MMITFYYQGVPCDGSTIYKKPLGGTESAMIYMARALAARGHEIYVFNEVARPGTYEGVVYRSWREFEEFSIKNTIDVFICLRNMIPLLAGRWARLQVYFSPDAHDQPFVNRALLLSFQHEKQDYEIGLCSLAFAQRFTDAIFCVGEWQAQTFIERFSLNPRQVVVAHNGVHLPNFQYQNTFRKRQIVYCSTPFRGLEYLLKYFPEIRKQVPDATCVILSGMQLYGMSAEEDERQYGDLYRLANQPGVTLLGPLPQPELAKVLAESRVLAYPNTFAETFCIAALEAQAAGLPIVTTKLAGLRERVTEGVDGYLVEGHPNQELYRNIFIDRTVKLLTDDSVWLSQSHAAREKAQRFSYDSLAAEWEGHFEKLLTEPRPIEPKRPFLPVGQSFDILANGHPQRVELSEEILMKHYLSALELNGFPRTAENVRRIYR